MKIQYASDIHLEREISTTFEDVIAPQAPVLVLAGDIGCPLYPSFRTFLEKCSDSFETTIVVAGNHEYRSCIKHCNVDEYEGFEKLILHVDTIIYDICKNIKGRGKVLYLKNGESIRIDKINFIGATLWSNIPLEILNKEDMKSIESYLINFATIQNNNKIFQQHLIALEKSINEGMLSNHINIIVTHHCPILNGMFKKDVFPKNYLYAADLKHALNQKAIYAWIYGHTHWNVSTCVNGTIVACNQYGGDKIVKGFKKNAMLNVMI